MIVTVPSAAANFVAGGGRDVNHEAAIEPGVHVHLVDDQGAEVGMAVADPENKKLRVLAVPSDGFTKLDGALLGLRVERALAWRKRLGLPGPDHAYRLVHGAGDGLPGFACDVLGTAVSTPTPRPRAGKTLAEAIAGFAAHGAVVVARAGRAEVAQECRQGPRAAWSRSMASPRCIRSAA
ncbi:MAG: hypothetical protein WKG01_02180 [Kofleriaceae bacterium]